MSVDFSRDGSVVSCPSVITGFTAPFPNRGQARVMGSGTLESADYRLTAGDALRGGDLTWKRLLGGCDFWFAIVPDHQDSGGAVAYRLEDLEAFGLVPAEVAANLRAGQASPAERARRSASVERAMRDADAGDAAFSASQPGLWDDFKASFSELKDSVVPGAPTFLVVGLLALAAFAVSRR